MTEFEELNRHRDSLARVIARAAISDEPWLVESLAQEFRDADEAVAAYPL